MREASSSAHTRAGVALKLDDLVAMPGGNFSNHLQFISDNTRGFGFCIWKPRSVLLALERLENSDYLAFLDAGCSIRQGKPEFWDWLGRIVDRQGIAFTHLDRPHFGWQEKEYCEFLWTKSSVAKKLGASSEHLSSPQRQAGVLFLKRSPIVYDLLNEWMELLETGDYWIIDDSPSPEGEVPGFRGHRHDQSVFSLLSKRFGLDALTDFTWAAPDWVFSGRHSPVWAMRWRTGDDVKALSGRFLVRCFRSAASECRVKLRPTARGGEHLGRL